MLKACDTVVHEKLTQLSEEISEKELEQTAKETAKADDSIVSVELDSSRPQPPAQGLEFSHNSIILGELRILVSFSVLDDAGASGTVAFQQEVAIEGATVEKVSREEGTIIESVVHDFAELMSSEGQPSTDAAPSDASAPAAASDDVMMEVTVEEKGTEEELLQFTTKDIREKNPKLLDYIKV